MLVTFYSEVGDLPLMTADSSSVSIGEETKGTKAGLECSGRGLCGACACPHCRPPAAHRPADRSTGDCACFNGWTASDAAGNKGFRPDCGARDSLATSSS